MLDFLHFDFMQRALIAGVIIGFVAPLIGVFVVLRKMSLIGESLSHLALSGVAVSVLFDINPVIGAMAFCIFGSLGIQALKENYRKFEDISLSVIMSAGMALAVVLIGISKNRAVNFMSYLFGSIGSISNFDIIVMIFLSLVIIVFLKLYFYKLFYISFDEEGARVSGISVKTINTIFIVLVSLVIVICMRIVGILLISSMLVIPIASAMRISKSFRSTLILSFLFSQVSVLSGIILSYYYDLASGGIIVLINIFILLACIVHKKVSVCYKKNCS
ncbi:zinc transport system permease protein [Alkalithermobacter thermoalcaliphilus JW-YL-7 = DSM 7308]|uniref:ABC-type transporter, integral membrane subunit n=1 Tax=Alkalithermobacter thermoalcaliphilus JW-YL-7 = DSM 7308 TaxID=1121328 RepID=A0A150FRR5_CLOPD|nr:ABC-type transporter, integral membrane subunit [[Clostridium] paradoxum JW-YL-7 = DSM 7308]SHK38489.1 zinc transport system permease protein [[Clostridium] paradoxum JW-YL-7 = DSM 7308]